MSSLNPDPEIFADFEKLLYELYGNQRRLLAEQKDPEIEKMFDEFFESSVSKEKQFLTPSKNNRDPVPPRIIEKNFPTLAPLSSSTDNCLPVNEARNLDSLRLRLHGCEKCPLYMKRTRIVFGQGNANAELMFIGEGPGETEDRQGLAFVGRAGKLFTEMLLAIGIKRDSVYITNAVKCRPPDNRTPRKEEVQECFPILQKQIEFVQPKLLVTLGNIATKALLPDAFGIKKIRGKLFEYNNIRVLPTYHPAYLLRNNNGMFESWIDFRKIRQLLFNPPHSPKPPKLPREPMI